MVDAVLYINLAHRTDRNSHFLSEISKFCPDMSIVHRIDAIKHTPGMFGCLLSHIKALETFEEHTEWNKVIIFEDDFTFYDSDISNNTSVINSFLESFSEWDVLNLSYNPIRVVFQDTHIGRIKRTTSTQTASGYMVNRHFIQRLLTNLREARDLIIRNGPSSELWNDQYWKRLQPVSNWYLISPALGYQCDSFSDIEQRNVSYKC